MAEVLSQRVQDGFVLLAITDTKFLGICRKSVKPQFFSSQVTEDMIAICYAYYDQFQVAPDNHFHDELERFLRKKDEDEKDLYSEQLSTILDFFDRLKEVDTENIPPTSHVLDLVNAYRPDQVRPGPGVEAVLRNAPDRANRFFRVPKILD